MDYLSFVDLYNRSLPVDPPARRDPQVERPPQQRPPEVGLLPEERGLGKDWTKQLSESASARRKFKLWEETQGLCIYCGKSIQADDFINGVTSDIEHIIPQRFGGRSVLDNITVACRVCNREKGDLTAIDYILSRPPEVIRDYFARIRMLASAGFINREKYINLITPKRLIVASPPPPLD